MISPYFSKIAATKKDIGIIEDALASLGRASSSIDDFSDNLTNLGTHISAGFEVSCSAAEVAAGPRAQLDDSRRALEAAKSELEGELDSLVQRDVSWRQEQAQAQAQARLSSTAPMYGLGW